MWYCASNAEIWFLTKKSQENSGICLPKSRLLDIVGFPLVLPFLVFLEFLAFFPCEEFLVFLSVFPFFSRDFRGSVKIKILFFWWFSWPFSKKNKERKDRVRHREEQPAENHVLTLLCKVFLEIGRNIATRVAYHRIEKRATSKWLARVLWKFGVLERVLVRMLLLIHFSRKPPLAPLPALSKISKSFCFYFCFGAASP